MTSEISAHVKLLSCGQLVSRLMQRMKIFMDDDAIEEDGTEEVACVTLDNNIETNTETQEED